MFSNSVELYDLIYSRFKDYEAEALRVAQLLRQTAPGARTILDVACGTGEHARILAGKYGFEVDGLDIEPGFVEQARRKHPGGRFFQGDLTSFDLGRRYDVVTCLFSSIGYARTLDRVTDALRCFARHLGAGGVVLVEPWFTPDVWNAGRVDCNTASAPGMEVVRMSHAAVRDSLSILMLDYLIGTASGIEHRREIHELGLFETDELLSCFDRAGLVADFDPVGLIGRGLYVGRARAPGRQA